MPWLKGLLLRAAYRACCAPAEVFEMAVLAYSMESTTSLSLPLSAAAWWSPRRPPPRAVLTVLILDYVQRALFREEPRSRHVRTRAPLRGSSAQLDISCRPALGVLGWLPLLYFYESHFSSWPSCRDLSPGPRASDLSFGPRASGYPRAWVSSRRGSIPRDGLSFGPRAFDLSLLPPRLCGCYPS